MDDGLMSIDGHDGLMSIDGHMKLKGRYKVLF